MAVFDLFIRIDWREWYLVLIFGAKILMDLDNLDIHGADIDVLY